MLRAAGKVCQIPGDYLRGAWRAGHFGGHDNRCGTSLHVSLLILLVYSLYLCRRVFVVQVSVEGEDATEGRESGWARTGRTNEYKSANCPGI